ncbi:MAG: AMP-binding protein, partial [Candidatus Zixiibacteriota bacterium]
MKKIPCPVAAAAKIHPESAALISGNFSLSYAAFDAAIAQAVHSLQQAGVSSGRRVALLADNSSELPVMFWGLFRLGAVACPINPRLPVDTVIKYIDRIRCRFLLHASGRIPECAGVERLHFTLADVLDSRPDSRQKTAAARLSHEQDATIVATSGTTTIPKAVLHTFANHYFNALGSNENIELQPGDRWLLSLPLYHVGGIGILFRTMLAGATVVVPDRNEDVASCISRYSLTHLSLVPTQL